MEDWNKPADDAPAGGAPAGDADDAADDAVEETPAGGAPVETPEGEEAPAEGEEKKKEDE